MGLGVDVPMVVVEHPYSVLAADSLIFLVTVWLVTALAMHLARRPASKKS